MNKLFLLLLVSAVAGSAATIDITVTPTLGPSYGSTSYPAFAQNVVDCYRGGACNTGAGPTMFNSVSGILTSDFIQTTDLPNWRGVVNPGGDFSSEVGTFLYFTWYITSDEDFSLDQVLATVSSTDSSGGGDFNYGPVDYTFLGGYADDFVGFDSVGTPITSGSESQPVRALVGVGEAFGLFATGITDQADLNDYVKAYEDYFGIPYSIQTCIELGGVSSCGGVDVVPEPATVGLTGLGLGGLLLLARRMRVRRA